MERMTRSASAADAASILDSVRQARREIRSRYLRSFLGGGWLISLALGVATFGSLAVTSVFGNRTIDGGQAVFGAYWAAAGLITLVAVWVMNRREPVLGRTGVHLVSTCAVFALAFASVFFSQLAHNHLYLSPTLFATAYLVMAAVQERASIGIMGLVLGAALGAGGLSPVLADGRAWPLAIYGAAFVLTGTVSRLFERRAE